MSAALVVLGTGGAMQTARRDNTSLACQMDDRAVLVDCPGSPYLKLLRAGIDPMRLAAVVITHTHPDHVYGFPSLIHNMWMMDRDVPAPHLPVYAPTDDHGTLRTLLTLFNLDERAAFVELRALPADPEAPFFEHAGHRFYAHAVDHGPPAFAIRWDTPQGHRVLYSTDTRPLDALAEFGRGADLYVHEATYAEIEADAAQAGGHTTAAQAGRLAAQANAKRLVLVHLADYADPEHWVMEARATFAGPVEMPEDGAVYPVG